ncbi:MAG: NAD(P)/FAD-dependent oxidoreductase, partial [Pseudomonadota bacterium]
MPEELELKKLFEPTQIGRMELKNRLVCPPMVRNYGTGEGFVTQQTLDHYEALARGGVGLIIVEATCVEAPRGRGWDYGLVLDEDRFIEGFGKLAGVIHRYGTKVAVQLHHAGPAAEIEITHMRPVGPSARGLTRALTEAEIREIVTKFAEAAGRAKRAGLDAVEIHGAHGYLPAQFLSPAVNKRTDHYGGSLENRARLLLEVLVAVRESVGKDFPAWCRINGQEIGVQKGLTIEESTQVAVMLEKARADAIHVSASGAGRYVGYNSGVMYDPPGNLLHLSQAIKETVHIPVIAVGRLTLELAERALREDRADLAALGRSLLVDPDLPRKAMEGDFEDIRPCLWCRTCGDVYLHVKRTGIRCQVNAALGHEGESILERTEHPRRVLVIGGGPAGMEAARVAALRGHEVMLFEKE